MVLLYPGDVARFTVESQTGVVRLNGPPETWDFETQPNNYMVTVRATDSPGQNPRLTVSLFLAQCKENNHYWNS